MKKLYEDDIEQMALQELGSVGYEVLHGGDIAPDSDYPQRNSYQEVILQGRLEEAIRRINSSLSEDLLKDAIRQLNQIHSPELLANNEAFHRLLTEGIPVSYQREGEERGELVWLIDFENPLSNDFVACNQYTIEEDGKTKRPDILLFVNGLPLVVIELKNPTDENATLKSAYQQIETYKATIPSLFTYNGINVISDGLDAQAGSLSAGFTRFMSWKTSDGKKEAHSHDIPLLTMIKGMLNPATLLDLVRYFTVFEKSKSEDANGLITISTVKKIAAYHQYYAVNKAVDSTLRASGYATVQTDLAMVAESPLAYGLPDVQNQREGDRKGGVVWHTQGSGKSLSMVFYTGKIVQRMDNPTIVVITDRNDLDDQLFETFASSSELLRQTPVQAESIGQLKELLKVRSGGIVFTTIQKFQPDEGNQFDTLSSRENIIVIADEAHRTQYGFKAKVVDAKDDQGNIIGKKTVYGFAKYMRDALPNATYLGFTGTPIEGTDKNTPAVFGNYIDVYDIAQAVEDGATVPIFYESRLAKIELTEEGRKLIEELDEELKYDELSETEKMKARWTQLEALVGTTERTELIAKDILFHFGERQKVFEGKAMVVAMSRRIAAELYEAIIQLQPTWHSDELTKGKIKVIMTSASSDGPLLAKHHTSKQDRRLLADRMKNPEDELQLVIVCDMWLTGFDAPCLHTLYIDKPMKGHNLMQAIARVNRVYKDKPGGLIVDYLGIASDLKEALSFYSDAGGKGDPTIAQEQAVEIVLEKIEVIRQLFHGFDYKIYFTANTQQKLQLILKAQEFILGVEDGRKRLIDGVSAISKAFAIAVPNEEAMALADEIAFYQAIKARLIKLEGGLSAGGSDSVRDESVETTIRQVIDSALVSDQVIDVFDAAGIKKPDISILSEEFMAEIKGMEHKNIAIEVLKKILRDEIKTRSKTNIVQGKTLIARLEDSIKRYHNKILTAAEVIDELIKLSKSITESDKEAQELGLTDYEYAFYTAVAQNESARELMGKDMLRELAVALTETIRKNASIDWTIKESVKARLKVAVKRLLRRYGFPPDMQKLATEAVIKQAEELAKQMS